MEMYRRLVIIILAAAVVIPVVLTSRRSPLSRTPAAFSVVSSAQNAVRISGDVRHPGIYFVTVNKMAEDAIAMAMPSKPVFIWNPPASTAIPVRNGEALHVIIDDNGSAFVTKGSMPAAERLVMGIPLDINSMSEADLDRVPGVGPALAGRIAQYRQNNGGSMSVQELLLIEGIGEKKFKSLRNFF